MVWHPKMSQSQITLFEFFKKRKLEMSTKNKVGMILIQADGTEVRVEAPNSTILLVVARTIYDSFEKEVWMSKRP